MEMTQYEKYLNTLKKEELIKMLINKEKPKEINIKNFKKVYLRLNYDGRFLSGLVEQPNNITVADVLLNALHRSGLLTNISQNDLEFAGRTDSGVSGINMICSITLKYISDNFEYDYYINKHLPKNIRISGWYITDNNFSVRNDCIERHYKYFFYKNNLDINRIIFGINLIKNVTDFRKFSKFDKSKPEKYYQRKINEIYLENMNDFYILNIKSKGFTRNMVRKIFNFLENIGNNKILLSKLINSELNDSEILIKHVENISKNGSEEINFEINYEYINSLNIGKADPKFLLFYNAKYNEKIKWKVSEKNLKILLNESRDDYLYHKMTTIFINDLLSGNLEK